MGASCCAQVLGEITTDNVISFIQAVPHKTLEELAECKEGDIVRLVGVVAPYKRYLLSPLSGSPCVWYRMVIGKYSTLNSGFSIWMPQCNEDEAVDFLLRGSVPGSSADGVVIRGMEAGSRYLCATQGLLNGKVACGMAAENREGYATKWQPRKKHFRKLERASRFQVLLLGDEVKHFNRGQPPPMSWALRRNTWFKATMHAMRLSPDVFDTCEGNLQLGATVTVVGAVKPPASPDEHWSLTQLPVAVERIAAAVGICDMENVQKRLSDNGDRLQRNGDQNFALVVREEMAEKMRIASRPVRHAAQAVDEMRGSLPVVLRAIGERSDGRQVVRRSKWSRSTRLTQAFDEAWMMVHENSQPYFPDTLSQLRVKLYKHILDKGNRYGSRVAGSSAPLSGEGAPATLLPLAEDEEEDENKRVELPMDEVPSSAETQKPDQPPSGDDMFEGTTGSLASVKVELAECPVVGPVAVDSDLDSQSLDEGPRFDNSMLNTDLLIPESTMLSRQSPLSSPLSSPR